MSIRTSNKNRGEGIRPTNREPGYQESWVSRYVGQYVVIGKCT